ncbi:MAG: hypothetical protein HY298_10710 [Verrucomicrobia bacterium]|nr:hypothetical protein [Verrucomicrobiota bacterium]
MKINRNLRWAFLSQFVFVVLFAAQLYAPVVGDFHVRYAVGLTLACNPLDRFPPGVNNAVPVPLNGVSIFAIRPEGFVADNYLGGWTDPDLPLPPGDAWFLRNPLTLFTNEFFGAVHDGTNQLSVGWNVCGAIAPYDGLLSTDHGCPVVSNDVVYIFNSTNQAYEAYTFTTNWQPFEPSIAVAQGFWIQKSFPAEWTELVLPPGNQISHSLTTISSTVGQINFFTYNPLNGGLGRVFDLGGSVPAGTNYFGQLYASLINQESSLNPIGLPIHLLGGTWAGYIRGSSVNVPDTVGGDTVYLQLRV